MALVGDSGAGKTSAALAVMGLWPGRAGGAVIFGGEDLSAAGPAAWRCRRGRELVMMAQDPMVSLNPVLTIGTQIVEILRYRRGLSRRESKSEAQQWLARVGLAPTQEIMHLYVHQLSGGMAQRTALAMALACRPALLVADEPFSALDPQTAAEQTTLLKRYRQDLGFSLLLIAHDLRLARDLADDVVVLKNGRTVEAGPAAAVFAGAGHEYTRALLAAGGLVEPAGAPR